jgi:hypothetical protein
VRTHCTHALQHAHHRTRDTHPNCRARLTSGARTHRVAGLNWLYLLHSQNLNGILADESTHPFLPSAHHQQATLGREARTKSCVCVSRVISV